MASFNPTVQSSSSDSSGESAKTDDTIPSGDYLVRAVWFDRCQNKAGTAEYLRVKWEILAGPKANTAFFANLSCKIEVEGVASRWRSLCKGLEITESFEIGGPEGDRDFARLIKGRPVRARVNREESNGYTNFDIQRTHAKATWTPGEVKAVKDLADNLLGSEAPPTPEPPADDTDDIPF